MGQGLSLRRRGREEASDSAAMAVHDAGDAAEQVDDLQEIGAEEYVPVKKRRLVAAASQQRRQSLNHDKHNAVPSTTTSPELHGLHEPSLLLKSSQLKKDAPAMTDKEALIKQEQEMIQRLSEKKYIFSPNEIVQPMQTGWKPPRAIRGLGMAECDSIRRRRHILVEGEDVPAPISSFKYMCLPEANLAALKAKDIAHPTPIQVQGLSVILSGRDMIGVASTGSGKTLAFALPFICFALQEEVRMGLMGGEGPVGLILCPLRELVRQTFDVIGELTSGYPHWVRSMLCIGGVDMRAQLEVMKQGVHILVATPGRLKDMLVKKKMNLNNCKYLTLEETDRLLDLGFEEDIREIFSYFEGGGKQ